VISSLRNVRESCVKETCVMQALVTFLFVIAPVLAHSTTYYVAKTGSDLTSCSQAQSISTPKLTINGGLSCMQGGDTLVIKAGTYGEGINNTIPAGSSTSNRTKVIGLKGERWTMRPDRASQCFNDGGALYIRNRSFIEIADMILDGTNCTGRSALFWSAGTSSHHVLRDSELKNMPNGSGLLFQAAQGSRHTVRNVVSHDHGNDHLHHCFYPSGNDHVFEHVEAYNCSGHGMHLYNTKAAKSNNNVIRWSYFHDNGSRGILIGSGNNNVAENNRVQNNGRRTPAGAVTVGFHVTENNQVNDNIIYSNNGECIVIRKGSINSKIRNNICWQNSRDSVRDQGDLSIISNTRVINPLADTTGALMSPLRSMGLSSGQVGERR
jgi:Right handed beta helix region